MAAKTLESVANKRKENRYPIALRCKTEEGDGMEEQLLEISYSGCRFTSPVIFKRDETIVLHLPEAKHGHEIAGSHYLLGQIMWEKVGVHQRSEYGVQILNPSPKIFGLSPEES